MASVTCFECGKTGHTRNYCPNLRNRTIRGAAVHYDDEVVDAPPQERLSETYGQEPLGEERPQREDPITDQEEVLDEPNAIWLSEEEYLHQEAELQYEDDLDEPIMGACVVKYPDYEERRETLLNITLGSAPVIKMAAAKQAAEEPVYDHRLRPKERPRPPRGHPDTQVFAVYMNVGGSLAHCLIDCGCEGVMVSSDYARALKMPLRRLAKPVTLQLACQGSRSMINHGVATKVDVGGHMADEYFDVANIDYYDVILGMPFLRRFQVKLDFADEGEIKIGEKSYRPGNSISLTGVKTPSVRP
jgi:hypothetical protein